MRICGIWNGQPTAVLKIMQRLFDQLKKNRVIRPDTEISIKTVGKLTLVLRPYAETLYFDLLERPYIVEAVIQAEKEGYDAAFLFCYFDPGLDEAREVVRIPVVGVAESSLLFAMTLGRKKGSTAVVTIGQKGVLKISDVIDRYGLNSQLIPVRPVRQVPLESYTKAIDTDDAKYKQVAKDDFIKVAKDCVRDGAEVIISACGGLGPLLVTEGVYEVEGIPVLDCVTCAIKMAENLADFQKAGISVSRRLMYRSPLEEDWNKERQHFGFS